MRTKVDYRQESRETYKNFLAKYPELKKELSYMDFQSIIKEFNYLIRDYILETGTAISLPYGVGRLYVVKRKGDTELIEKDGKFITINKRVVDPVASKKYGKKMYFMNSHTDGFIYEIYWDKYSVRLPFKSVWRYKSQRLVSRLLGHYIKNTDCVKNYTAIKYKDKL